MEIFDPRTLVGIAYYLISIAHHVGWSGLIFYFTYLSKLKKNYTRMYSFLLPISLQTKPDQQTHELIGLGWYTHQKAIEKGLETDLFSGTKKITKDFDGFR